MESIQYGTPVIGADIGGIPELIDDGITGELFESGNAEQLTEKVEKLWNNHGLLNQYSMNCLNKQFTQIKEYSKIYEEMIYAD